MEDEYRKKCCLLIIIALLVAFMAYFLAQNAQNTADNANQTANAINISNASNFNASYASEISALQVNDTYFNGTGFPNSIDFRNNTMFNHFESGKVNKSGDTMTGQLDIITQGDSDLKFNATGGNVVDLKLENNATGGRNWIIRATQNSISPTGSLIIQDATAGINRMSISPTGQLFEYSLGASSQSNALCYNSGTKEITYNSGITSCSASNESLKTNITPITSNITPFLMNLTPIKYNLQFENQNLINGGYHVGFSAQSVKSVIASTPYNNTLIGYNPDGTISGLRYEEIIPFLVKVIQEQQTTINQQQNTLNKICSRQPSLCN